MTMIRLKYVKAYSDRHGRRRYYLRKPGAQVVALPGEPGSKEFLEAYREALENAAPRQIGMDRNKPGSFNALIALYKSSSDYKNLKDITRQTYRNDLKRFQDAHGDMSVRTIQRKHVSAMLDAVAAQGKSQKSLRRMLGVLLTLAHERGWRTDNPMTGLRRPKKAGPGFKDWSEREIALYEARWPVGTRERLAFDLLLYTVQRRSDVVIMGRQHLRDGRIHVATSKSNGQTRLWIKIHTRLQASLALVPRDQLTFLQTQYGVAFSPDGFTNWFRENAKAAGCVGFTPHGLRKAGLRRLAEDGCTAKELMALSGHKNLAEVTLYTDAADQELLADQAIAKAEKRTKVTNL